jgi:hypothetical protein
MPTYLGATPANGPKEQQPRLVLVSKRASQAVLDGGWWPRSWDAAAELPGLVAVLSERFGRIRSLILHGPTWEGHVRRMTVAGNLVRVGWFTSASPALLIASTDTGDQLDLLVVPPPTDRITAEAAMTAAASSSNVDHAATILAVPRQVRPDTKSAAAPAKAGPETARARAVREADRDGAVLGEAVWANEGGADSKAQPPDATAALADG